MEALGKLIRAAREAAGMSQTRLGELVGGVSRSAVAQWESGATKPESDKLPTIARVLHLPAHQLLGLAQGGRETDKTIATGTMLDGTVTLPHRGEMPRDIPIRGTVSGGPGGYQMSNGDAIDWARRPPRLAGRTDVFGLYVEDTSMMPAFKPGALIFVESARPPSPGDDIVMELRAENPRDEQRAILKTLIAVTPTLVRVEQYNPTKVLEIPRARVIRMLRVMTMVDLFS